MKLSASKRRECSGGMATDFTLERPLSEAELETFATHFGGQCRILGAKIFIIGLQGDSKSRVVGNLAEGKLSCSVPNIDEVRGYLEAL